MERRTLEEQIMAYMYVVQSGYPNPLSRGVLIDDIRSQFEGENVDSAVDAFLFQGLIERARLGKLLLVTLTTAGQQRAQSVIQSQCNDCTDSLKPVIEDVPARLLRFLFPRASASHETLDIPGGWCVLEHQRIGAIWSDILNVATEYGLLAEATFYVGTKGGDTRDVIPITAREFIDLCSKLARRTHEPSTLSPDHHIAHRLFHLLSPPFTFQPVPALYFQIPHLRLAVEKLGLPMDRVTEEVLALTRTGLLRRERIDQFILSESDQETYKAAIRQKYLRPIVDWLLEREEPGLGNP
ncbi:MAG: hypothetical protein Q8O40_03215 [Chloroflexota bacterium]|nr:hypothetical protein [Chloroflexota bacterium]